MTRLTPSLVERIVEVLEPFAREAEGWVDTHNETYGLPETSIIVGDLLAARALLADLKSAPPADDVTLLEAEASGYRRPAGEEKPR